MLKKDPNLSFTYYMIFFSVLSLFLALIPPLIYSYSKNLLMKLNDKDKDNKEYNNVVYYFYFTDQVVFDWGIYIIFSMITGLLVMAGYKCFHILVWIVWLLYACCILGVALFSFFSKQYAKKWKVEQNFWKSGKWWILFICFYSLSFVPLIIKVGLVDRDGVLIIMLGFALGFYALWHIVGGWLYRPLTSLLTLKGIDS